MLKSEKLAARITQSFEYYKNKANYTQHEFADKWGIKHRSLQHYLAGSQTPKFDQIERFANSFPEINIDWLATGKGNMLKYANELRHFVSEPAAIYKNAEETEEEHSLIPTARTIVECWDKLQNGIESLRQLTNNQAVSI